jgi:hypothetical protein
VLYTQGCRPLALENHFATPRLVWEQGHCLFWSGSNAKAVQLPVGVWLENRLCRQDLCTSTHRRQPMLTLSIRCGPSLHCTHLWVLTRVAVVSELYQMVCAWAQLTICVRCHGVCKPPEMGAATCTFGRDERQHYATRVGLLVCCVSSRSHVTTWHVPAASWPVVGCQQCWLCASSHCTGRVALSYACRQCGELLLLLC